MSADPLKVRARQFFAEVWNAHNPDAVDEYLAEDFRQERPLPGVSPDRNGIKEWVRTTTEAFPDVSFSIDEQLGEGDTVVTRWTVRGTHEGSFMGIPATGKTIEVVGFTRTRYADGKAQSNYILRDTFGLMRQLGARPAREVQAA